MQNSTSNTPQVLKYGMYASEIFIINVLFYIFFKDTLSPASDYVLEVSALFGWMSMTMTMCYVFGVAIKPITFFYRASRRGSITHNVVSAILLQAAFFLFFVVLVGRMSTLHGMGATYDGLLLLLLFFLSEIVVLMCWRCFARFCIRYLRSNGHNVHRVVFVGSGDNLRELYHEMENPFYGYRVLGYFDNEPNQTLPGALQYLGTVSDVIPYLQTHRDVRQLYCALPSVMASEIRPIVDQCENSCVRFFSVPNVRNYLKRQMQFEMMGSVPVLYIREDPLQSLTNRFIKRTFDIVVSSVFLVFFWTLIYPVIAVLSKVLQPGPVFFRQKRNGLNGEEFECIKFRSMKVNAEADTKQAVKDDPRKTPFGNFLRKTSIDELPQFINVWKGEMSIVGPRPHMVKHTEEYSRLIEKYMVRHWVRPGITGWAQVNGARGETEHLWQMEDRIRKDIWYIENWTLTLDIKIICKTVINAIVGDKQAY